MARKQKKYHYIYKTICNVTNKFYIGMHSTDNIDDGYLGSGKRLWYSLRKYGKNNHSIEILEYCNDRKELKRREAEIVNEDLLNEDLCMNLMVGGNGGFAKDEHQEMGNKVLNEKLKSDPDFRNQFGSKVSEAVKKGYENGSRERKYFHDWNGEKHSEETKQKMSESSKGQGKGKTNSQYGTCWIVREGESKKVKKEDLNQHLKEGWIEGRKLR